MIKNIKTRAQPGLAFATVGALLSHLTQDVRRITEQTPPNVMLADFKRFYASGRLMAEAGNLLMKGSATATGFDKASEVIPERLTVLRKQQVTRADEISARVMRDSRNMRLLMPLSALAASAP